MKLQFLLIGFIYSVVQEIKDCKDAGVCNFENRNYTISAALTKGFQCFKQIFEPKDRVDVWQCSFEDCDDKNIYKVIKIQKECYPKMCPEIGKATACMTPQGIKYTFDEAVENNINCWQTNLDNRGSNNTAFHSANSFFNIFKQKSRLWQCYKPTFGTKCSGKRIVDIRTCQRPNKCPLSDQKLKILAVTTEKFNQLKTKTEDFNTITDCVFNGSKIPLAYAVAYNLTCWSKRYSSDNIQYNCKEITSFNRCDSVDETKYINIIEDCKPEKLESGDQTLVLDAAKSKTIVRGSAKPLEFSDIDPSGYLDMSGYKHIDDNEIKKQNYLRKCPLHKDRCIINPLYNSNALVSSQRFYYPEEASREGLNCWSKSSTNGEWLCDFRTDCVGVYESFQKVHLTQAGCCTETFSDEGKKVICPDLK